MPKDEFPDLLEKTNFKKVQTTEFNTHICIYLISKTFEFLKKVILECGKVSVSDI